MKVQDYGRATTAAWKLCELLGLPPPKELRIIESLDTKLLAQFAEMMQKRGENPNELLAALNQEIAARDGSDTVH